MVNPSNNAYDVIYTTGAVETPQMASELPTVNVPQRTVAPVSELIARSLQTEKYNAQQYVDAVTANAGALATATATEGLRRQRSGKSGVADLANVVAQGVNIAYETRTRSELARNEQEAKIAEALAKQQREQADIDFEIAQNALRTEAPSLLRGEGGSAAYQRRMVELVNQYRDTASPEAVSRITGELFTPLQEYNRSIVEATLGTVQQEADSSRNIASRQFSVLYSGRMNQLALANTPDEQRRITDDMLASIGADTANMTPADRAFITGNLLTTLGENFDLSSGRFATANAGLQAVNGYSQAMVDVLATYENDRNLSNFRFNENRIALQYPDLPPNARYQSPDQDLQHALNMADLQNRTRDAQRDLLLSEGELIQIGNDTVTDLAYTLFSNPASQPLYDSVLGNNPEYKQALAVAQLLRDQQTTNESANARIQEHQLTIQNLSTQNVQQTLSWANSQNEGQRQQYQQMVQNLVTLPGVSSQVQTLAQQYLQAQSTGQPVPQAMIDELNQAVISSREQSISIVQSQIALETQRINSARQMLAPYGLDTPEGIESQLANSRDTLGNLNNRISETRRNAAAAQGRQNIPGARNGGAVSPNFRMPRLATATVGNLAAALPFAEGTNAPLTGGDGLYMQRREYYNNGQGGYHQGIDIAVPVGTPLVSYNGGTVTYVGELDGYGNYVEITSDDGYVHRFAHLDSYSVKQGQRVEAGETFARTGGERGAPGAGRSSGPHLHWEVRVPSDKPGGGEAMNPLEYTSALERAGAAPRRPRNGQETDTQGMQLGGGQVLRNSQGGAGYSTSNPLRQRFASTRAADYQRSADGSANYGYAALADDRPFRLALHAAAARMNVPAQWLADVMGYETGGTFASNVVNQGGSGAVGIIQFMPDTLAAYGYTPEQFENFSNAQQLSVAVEYLEDVRREAGLTRWSSPYEVLMAVWGGGNNLRKFVADPESVRDIGDGDITWKEYTQRLGRNAGRRYAPIYDAPVQHTSFVQGCPTCIALLDNGNTLYSHIVAAGDVG